MNFTFIFVILTTLFTLSQQQFFRPTFCSPWRSKCTPIQPNDKKELIILRILKPKSRFDQDSVKF